MTSVSTPTAAAEPPEISLRNPLLAALLAWLIPGLGHLYQGRTAKGILFMVCILGTFFYGLYLGDGRVAYASWNPDEIRWAYFCQAGVGLPALPALVQANRVRNNKPPLFTWMAPPKSLGLENQRDELSDWNYRLHRYFELGTVYTMIAGLLNLLVIFDALAGPMPALVDDDEPEAAPQRSQTA